jgi:hypothetical protein
MSHCHIGTRLSAARPAAAAIELALDTAHAATIAPVWAAVLTGGSEARGRGSTGDDVRGAEGVTAGASNMDAGLGRVIGLFAQLAS